MKLLVSITAATLMLAAPMALAKGHDQSGTNHPGVFVGAETVAAAKTLGAARGNGQKPDAENGKSADAGRDAPEE